MTLLIRHKIFLVIFLANSLLAIAIFSSVAWNFSRDFNRYIQDDIIDRLTPLAESIGEAYGNNNSNWRWLRDNKKAWRRLLRAEAKNIMGRDRSSRLERIRDNISNNSKSTNKRGDKRKARLPRMVRLASHLYLRDKKDNIIVRGKSRKLKHYIWIPIESSGRVVGELGFPQDRRFTRELDQLFVKQLYSKSAFIIVLAVIISALIAVPFSIRVVRPITRLSTAMQGLSSGKIDGIDALPISGKDELAQLAQSFNYLSKTLKDQLGSRQQWVADISHELRTPVAVLRGELEAMLDGVRPLQNGAIESLHEEVMRLSRLIDDLYQLSLWDSGAANFLREKVDFAELIQDFLKQSQTELNEHKLNINVYSDEQEMVVYGDCDRLIQLARNLLVNTLRYTDIGGQLNIGLFVRGDSVFFSWQDSKPGVLDQDLGHLFDRLYRGSQARDRASGGAGLGLSICKAIAEMHGGHIEASHSDLGGLKIEVQLPIYRFA